MLGVFILRESSTDSELVYTEKLIDTILQKRNLQFLFLNIIRVHYV